ncbi:GIY-YIG nuclease family protein [Salipaludibacillus sp. HK11]|uniref:GIY-YIG nuclease family protein n=1 Tax=Salipaludibacillus sp. HK11 TaxID=3394320 RepID=UPI0039FD930E
MSVKNHYVYMLRCKDETFYTGYTIDVKRRLKVHEDDKGAKYTRGRGPFSLVYEEHLETKSEALRREIVIKRMSRKQKETLIKKKGDESDEGTAELSETK